MKRTTLVVIAAALLFLVWAVAYFGPLEPGRRPMGVCSFPGFICKDVTLERNRITFSLRNDGGDVIMSNIYNKRTF